MCGRQAHEGPDQHRFKRDCFKRGISMQGYCLRDYDGGHSWPASHCLFLCGAGRIPLLNKLGLEFTDAHAEGTAEDAAQRPGNSIPTKVPCKGTRLCIAGDKVAQSIRSIRQCVTSPMKRLLKRLPVEAGEPEAFKSLLECWS